MLNFVLGFLYSKVFLLYILERFIKQFVLSCSVFLIKTKELWHCHSNIWDIFFAAVLFSRSIAEFSMVFLDDVFFISFDLNILSFSLLEDFCNLLVVGVFVQGGLGTRSCFPDSIMGIPHRKRSILRLQQSC